MKKLFDLQTGEYLELGKEWLDGGEYIYVIPTHTLMVSRTDHAIDFFHDDKIEIIYPNETENSEIYSTHNGEKVLDISTYKKSIQYNINGKFYNKDHFTAVEHINPIKYSKKYHKTLTHELNTKWNGIFKGCVYGDRYLMINYINVINEHLNGTVYTLLEHYSKSLRGEENRLEEFESRLN